MNRHGGGGVLFPVFFFSRGEGIATGLLWFSCGKCPITEGSDPLPGISQEWRSPQEATPAPQKEKSPLNSRWRPHLWLCSFALWSNQGSPVEGKGHQCIQNSTLWIFRFSTFWVRLKAGVEVFLPCPWGGQSLSEGSTLFAVTPVARRVFVLTIRIPANGKCFFMLRSGNSIILCLGSCWAAKMEWMWRGTMIWALNQPAGCWHHQLWC